MTEQKSLIWPAAESGACLIDKAGLHQWTIAAGVVVRERRVDNGADRFIGNLTDRRQHLLGHLLVTGIDEQHTLIARLHGNVASRACEEIDVTCNLQRLDLEFGKVRILRKPRLAG